MDVRLRAKTLYYIVLELAHQLELLLKSSADEQIIGSRLQGLWQSGADYIVVCTYSVKTIAARNLI